MDRPSAANIGQPPAAKVRRCLLLIPANQAMPGKLLAALRKRDLAVRIVADAPAVMAELGAMEAGGTGGPGGPGAVVIVHQPQVLPAAQELRRAVAKFYPATVIWQSVEQAQGQAPRLSRFGPAIHRVPRREAKQENPCADAPRADGTARPLTLPPGLPLARQDDKQTWQTDPQDRFQRNNHQKEPLVSAEEMAMLLGGDMSSQRDRDDDGL